jgi:glycogen(starch) synthase
LEVDVYTCSFPGQPSVDHPVKGLTVNRVDVYNFPSPDFLSWTVGMNHSMLSEAVSSQDLRDYDLIHAHDWMVLPAAVSLKNLLDVPLVYSVHSTEYGRRKGIHTDFQRTIYETEGWGTYEASRIIVCSNYMRDHICWLFRVPRDKVYVIPNGVEIPPAIEPPGAEFRRRFAEDDERIVLYVGRIVEEKGVNVLIGAVPLIARSGVPVKLLVVGDGYASDRMKRIAWELGIYDRVFFTGYVDDAELERIYSIADAQAVPSLYEPFGIVALEGMARGVPIVASDTGGLAEIVDNERTGLKVPPDNSVELSAALRRLLVDKKLSETLKQNALDEVRGRFSWTAICDSVKKTYEAVLSS